MPTIQEQLDEVEALVRTKHQMGRHDQGKHAGRRVGALAKDPTTVKGSALRGVADKVSGMAMGSGNTVARGLGNKLPEVGSALTGMGWSKNVSASKNTSHIYNKSGNSAQVLYDGEYTTVS
jgi:hypothetical protein